MPHRETPFLPDQYYHFYNRGNNRQGVFFERTNYLYFLNGIRKYLCGSMDVLAYCLMPTHYHLLVRLSRCRSSRGSRSSLSSHDASGSVLHQSHQQAFCQGWRFVPGTIPWQTHPEIPSLAEPVRLLPSQPGQGWIGGSAARMGIFQLSGLDRLALRRAGQPGIHPGAFWLARAI